MPSIKSKIASQEYVVDNMWRALKRQQDKLKSELRYLEELKSQLEKENEK